MKLISKDLNGKILVLHLIVATLYLILSNYYTNYLYILYYGSESFIACLAIFAAINCANKYYSYIHIFFYGFRGLIYLLHFSDTFTTNNVERLILYNASTLGCLFFYNKFKKFNYFGRE
jgi:hypothetical protein